MGTSASYVAFNIQPGGNDLNGGAFDQSFATTGTNASTDDDPIVIIDGSSVTCTIIDKNTLELDGYDVENSNLGNCLFGQLDDSSTTWIQSGPVTSIDTTNNRWNFPSTQSWHYLTATEFTNARLGGALATPGGLADPSSGGDYGRMNYYCIAYIKAATYTMTSSDAESGGRIQAGAENINLIAYKTTPGDHFENLEDRAIIDTGSTANDSNGVIYFTTNRISHLTGIEVRGNDTWVRGVGGKISCYNCIVKDVTGYGYALSGSSMCHSCRAENCGSGSSYEYGFGSASVNECVTVDCSPYGFYACHSAFRSAAHGGVYGFGISQYQSIANCIADGCSTTGFVALSTRARNTNSIAINCATGSSALGGDGPGMAFYNCTTNVASNSDNPYGTESQKQLTADPFNDAANQDYTLNDTAGGGAELAERSPKWGAGVSVDGPQQQQSAQLKSTGGGSTTVVTPGPVQLGM